MIFANQNEETQIQVSAKKTLKINLLIQEIVPKKAPIHRNAVTVFLQQLGPPAEVSKIKVFLHATFPYKKVLFLVQPISNKCI